MDLVYSADKTGTGGCTIKSSLKGVDGTTADGATISPTTIITLYHDIFETDPGGGPITPSTIVSGGLEFTRLT
jgi:hypothetical protein